MNQNDNKVTTASINDAEGMAALNDKIYPMEWHVSPDYLKEILQRNPEVYRIYKSNGEVKGIYGLFPLNEPDYQAVLSGKIEENEILNYMIDYSQEKKVYLYFITMIVDIYDTQRKEFARKLIKDIPFELKRLKEKGISIEEIGAFAVSGDGERVLPKIGFQQNSGKTVFLNEHEYPVFRSNVESVLENISI